MRAIAVTLVALLLSGCATVIEPPPSDLTPQKRDAFISTYMDRAWQQTGLDDALRPTDPEVTFVSADDWAATIAECMNSGGFENYYFATSGALGVSYSTERSSEESVALYLCTVSSEVDPASFAPLNEAQRDYLYDYYATSLVPCLVRFGVPLIAPPTRAEFVRGGSLWNPYLVLPDDELTALLDDGHVIAQCPPDPAGAVSSSVWF